MSKVVVSPDISILDFEILLDISGATPSAKFTQASTQGNPANIDWIFELKSPSGTPIYTGDFSTPDFDNGWDVVDPFTIATGFPNPFNQIEWSGNPYLAKVKAKDSNGDIFELEKPIRVCRPVGNTRESVNSFGVATVEVKALCRTAQLWCEDKTNYGYQGITGTMVSKVFKLFHPEDATGTAPAPNTVNNFSSVLLPISQSGAGYRYFLASIFDYEFDDKVIVRVKYLLQSQLTVYCHLDITPIACEIQRLQSDVANGKCVDAAASQELLNKVTPKLLTAMIGIQYPQSGIDPFALVEEINKMTGWACNCCPNGIVPLASIAANDMAYDVNASGDITGDFEVIGNTVRLNISDKTYSFTLCEDIVSAAFSITPIITEGSKEFCFNVDIPLFASEMLTAIGNSTSLKNQLNALIFQNSGGWNIDVDMKCLGGGKSCDYSFATKDLTSVDSILIEFLTVGSGGISKVINFLFDKTNAQDLEDLLNTYGLGTFNVSFAAEVLTISTDANVNDITAISYSSYEMAITKDCTDQISISANEFAQKVVSWICGLILSQIKTGKGFIIKSLSGVGGNISELTVGSTEPSSTLITKLIDQYNSLVDIVKDIKEANCDSLKEVYEVNENEISNNDILHGTIGNACSKISIEQLGAIIMKMAQTSATVKTELCKAVAACATPICAAVTNMAVTYDSGTSVLDAEIQNTGALKYRVGYRLVSDTGILSPLLGIQEVAAVDAATTPVTWNGIAAGTYQVEVVAICAIGESAAFLSETIGCDKPTSFNIEFDDANRELDVTFEAPVGLLKIKLDIAWPNGGTYSAIKLVADGPFSVPVSAKMVGTAICTLRGVCDETAKWYSAPLVPINVDIPAIVSCSQATEIAISNIGENSVTVTALKAVGSNVNAFKLRLTKQSDNSVIELVANTPGANVIWNVAGLVSNEEYAVEVITLCTDSESTPAAGDSFITASSGANNSSVVNNMANNIAILYVKVNGAIIASSTNLAVSGTFAFYMPNNYVGATVEVYGKPSVGDGPNLLSSIVSDAITYNPDSVINANVIWNSIDITSGMAVDLSNTAP